MRLGIFGGSFDPVHLGHLITADRCREQAELDQVDFVPAAVPPHKQDRQLTPFERRVDMLNLALSGNPALQCNPVECERSGPSYTADTLAQLHERRPEAELFLILGADMIQDFPNWHKPLHILKLATLLIVRRSNWQIPEAAQLCMRLKLPELHQLRQRVVDMPLLDISSTDIRRRISQGQSIRYLTPRAVEAFIDDKGLYHEPE